MGGTVPGQVLTIAEFCAASAVLSAILCFYAAPIGRATGLLDHPDGKLKLHSGSTPLIGGVALFVPSFLLSFVYLGLYGKTPYMVLSLAAASAMFAVGVVDDRIGLSPRLRLVTLTLIVLAVFTIDPLFVLRALRFGIRDFNFGFSLGLLAVPMTAFMVIGYVNAVNMADGINGQFLGSIAVWSLLLARYLGLEPGMPFYAIFCSSLVVMSFNLCGRLFSGSAGAYTASFLIGLGTIAAYRRGGALSAVEPILWFWLPVFDCVRLMVSRSIDGKSPFLGDRNHFHHILQEYFGPRSPFVLTTYLALLAAPGLSTSLSNDRLTGTLVLVPCLIAYTALVIARPGLRISVAPEKSARREVLLASIPPAERLAAAKPAKRCTLTMHEGR